MSAASAVVVRVAGSTDVGQRRQHNEDSHGLWVPRDAGEMERRGALLVVADGMGGSQAGEVASRIAVQTVMRAYAQGGGDPLDDLTHAIGSANAAVHGESASRHDLAGMGTTCTAVVVRGRDLFYAHVGDSRAYVCRHGRMRQVTHDHSLVAQMVRDGQLTPEQARSDPRRNVVTRSVGVGPEVEVDADRMEGALEPGDTLLLCSDGLHGLVSDDELADIVSGPDLDQACREAIALANQRGGPDNITVLLARVDEEGRPAGGRDDVERTAEFPPRGGTGRLAAAPAGGGAAVGARPSSGTLMMWLIVAFMVLLLAVVAMALLWQRIDRERRALDATAAETRR